MTERERSFKRPPILSPPTKSFRTDCKMCALLYGVDIPGIFLYFNKATYDSNVLNLMGHARGIQEGIRFLVDYDRAIPSWRQSLHQLWRVHSNVPLSG